MLSSILALIVGKQKDRQNTDETTRLREYEKKANIFFFQKTVATLSYAEINEHSKTTSVQTLENYELFNMCGKLTVVGFSLFRCRP